MFAAIVLLTACGTRPAERNNAGNRLLLNEQPDAALRAYQAAQVAEPDLSVPYYNAAQAYLVLGNLDAAEAALEQALRTADDEMIRRAYYNLGEVYFTRTEYAESVAAYQQVLLRDPTDEDARYNLELALKRLPIPTPTPQEETAVPTPTPSPQPEEEQPTPTNEQGEPPSPTMTATPENTPTPDPDNSGDNNPGDSATEAPQPSGGLGVEEAEQLLNSVQLDQGILRSGPAAAGGATSPQERDW